MNTRGFYFFGGGGADGRGEMKDLLGGKGAGLAEMSRLGLPVPPGFTITTAVCKAFIDAGERWPDGFDDTLREALGKLEESMGRELGGGAGLPLLVSVRSGAPISMPGMMDTILNLGLNDRTVEGLASASGDRRFAFDSYRRFIQMYGDVVLGVDRMRLEATIDDRKRRRGVQEDTALDAEDWEAVVQAMKQVVEEEAGRRFPTDPWAQLKGAVAAVFKSWNNKRARDYRRIHDIPEDLGTAVNVQAMVFGNMGMDSATGVAFTRDPNTGEKRFFGEYLRNAQGEDVVAGIRTPQPLRADPKHPGESLEERFPDAFAELERIRVILEKHYRDMQDIEFTIEKGRLWMLQTRAGKRTAQAAVRIAVELVDEGLIGWDTALMRVKADDIEHLLHPTLDASDYQVLARGLPASPGAVSGRVVFDPEEAVERGSRGEAVILVRQETSPEDVMGMKMSVGILTSTGGMTSHAAVVGRGMGKCCVVGCQDIRIDEEKGFFAAGETLVRKDDVITLNGATGEVILGEQATKRGQTDDPYLSRLLREAEARARMKVRANADTPEDARLARSFGAQGIGLCRTEHMFFDKERIHLVRRMILSRDDRGRREALEALLPHQISDFRGIFSAMAGFPVTVRLLDPPLHEFLPKEEREIDEVARDLHVSSAALREHIRALHEFNPMLGHRGCRLGITHPDIYDMQVKAILSAAAQLDKEGVDRAFPEIMIPLVGDVREFEFIAARIVRVAEQVRGETGADVDFLVGTMIELPRAALTADRIAARARFFSFGTNDLTQTTYGVSRDDMVRFSFRYREEGIWGKDPFQTLDTEGVGRLVEMGFQLGRKARPDLKVGICGEHGGDPDSIAFCHRVGLDYVSCSPFRVPVARLAVGQAALKD